MDKDKGPISWLKKQLQKKDGDKKPAKYQYLLLVLLFGAAIMLISNLFSQQEASTVTKQTNQQQDEDVAAFGSSSEGDRNDIIAAYERAYETQLKEALINITGVEDVTVVVNVAATEKKVLEKNLKSQIQTTTEEDQEGGKRKIEDQSIDEQLVIIREGDKEVPIVVETQKPDIDGVLIVAEGADNIQVKKWIIEAVTRALDVPSHRVAVMPKKPKGDS
ncbi:stage III sporulation protein AG [Bacillaceae bacterium Marseille-Q3522]|nr:stage III sporulation protein AG [Bacillaceae bacterium Marseille-Q3522]